MAEQSATVPPVFPVYARQDVFFERGEGCNIYDDKGQRYLDMVAGIAVCAFGHAHPKLVESLHKQAQKLWIASNYYKSHAMEKLAQRFVDATFADSVFFQNSGVEAWELCIKVARKYQSSVGQPQRYRVITFQGCFHGRTLAAIAAAKSEKMSKGFGPMTDGFDQVAWNNLNELRAAITPETGAIMLEPIIGEGGVRVASPEFLREIRKICDEFGLLLLFDEIQCGMGRTGKLFAHEWSGVTPDVMCIAKAMGNGFPISACLATAKAMQGMTAGTHGTTYGGNPLGIAVADTVLDMLLAPGLLAEVERKGKYLAKGFDELVRKHPKVFTERRGVGLMQGLKCAPPNMEITNMLRDEKMLVAYAGDNLIRLLPPLIITEKEIDEAIDILDRVARKVTG
ncbi:MAG: acetylornithine/succinylornithine family transaminase [Alphaproteobacteria bacterium]|nr:acetylornithine/succinylornithine family transaminase [Alphaproteobacteria bacterium]